MADDTTHDTYDDMRSRTWDLWNEHNQPEDRLVVLFGVLGLMKKTLPEQQKELKAWLESPAAIPAPKRLKAAAQNFVDVPSG